MKLPAVITIADKPFRVEIKRSRGHGGEGTVDRDSQVIALYYDGKTTTGEMLDTLLHECLEAWAIMHSCYFRNADVVLLSFGHPGIRTFASTFARLVADVLAANGHVEDMTAPFSQ